MMKVSSLFLGIALAVGIALLRWSYETGSEMNSVPVHLPFPGAGFTVTDSFHLASGGRFMLEAITPAGEGEKRLLHREQPNERCDVAFTITKSNGLRIFGRTNSSRNSGWTRDTNIYFLSKTIVLPSGGEYQFSLTSHEPADVFGRHGAIIELTRFEPTGPELGYALARGLAYACFFIVLSGIVYLQHDRARAGQGVVHARLGRGRLESE